jgi:hypothetical protein
MKKNKQLFLVLLAIAIFSSCIKAPKADFEASKTKAKIGEEISFNNNSSISFKCLEYLVKGINKSKKPWKILRVAGSLSLFFCKLKE